MDLSSKLLVPVKEFEIKIRYEIISITVVQCTKKKNHGLLGKDVLKVNTVKWINCVESEESDIGLLKGYKASIRIK